MESHQQQMKAFLRKFWREQSADIKRGAQSLFVPRARRVLAPCEVLSMRAGLVTPFSRIPSSIRMGRAVLESVWRIRWSRRKTQQSCSQSEVCAATDKVPCVCVPLSEMACVF